MLSFDKTNYFYFYNFQTGFVMYLALVIKIFGSHLIFLKIFEILFDIVLLAIGYFNEKRWIKVTMLTFIILNLSGSQIKYNALYFMIPIIALLCENEYDILDIISIVKPIYNFKAGN